MNVEKYANSQNKEPFTPPPPQPHTTTILTLVSYVSIAPAEPISGLYLKAINRSQGEVKIPYDIMRNISWIRQMFGRENCKKSDCQN